MPRILRKKVAGVPMQDLIGAGIAKPVLEIVLSPFLGNANMVSGLVKLSGALLIGRFFGRGYIPRIGAFALAVDGTEDILMGTGITGMATGMVGGTTGEGW